MSMQITPVTPLIGAEVSGVNLASISSGEIEQLQTAFLDHLVLFFRDQDLSVDEHIAFGRNFGELHLHPAAADYHAHGDVPPEILKIHADESTKRTAGDKWHTDVSCAQEPPAASILKLEVLPDHGGDTLFSNMYAAYDALSEPMKLLLSKLTATHDGNYNYHDRGAKAGKDLSKVEYPVNSHPVVRTHPLTGRKSIYVNAAFTTHIDDVPEDESKAILDFLFAHTAKASFQCRFNWEPNSIAFWDNRCSMHHAIWDYFPQVRSGKRVTIKGDKPH